MEFNTLTTTLRHFVQVIDQGATQLHVYALALLATLMLIDVAMTGGLTALGEYGAGALVRRAFILGGWTFLTLNFMPIATDFINSLINAGFIAAGHSNFTSALLSDPSQLAGMGLDATEPLIAMIDNASTLIVASVIGASAGHAFFTLGVFALGWLVLIVIYFFMAFIVFKAQIEFHMALAVDGFLVPFGAWAPSRFIAEKTIGNVVAAGVKLMTLSLILGLVGPILANGIRAVAASTRANGGAMTVNALLASVAVPFCVALLAYFGPKWAEARAGSSSLASMGEIKQAATAAAGVGAAVATGGVAGAGAAAKAAAAGGKAAAYTAGSVSAGAKLGAALSGNGGALSRFAGGAKGAASGAAAALGDGLGALWSGKAAGAAASVSGPSGPSAAGSAGAAGRASGAPGSGSGGAYARGVAARMPKAGQVAAPPSGPPAGSWSAASGRYEAPPVPNGLAAGPIAFGAMQGAHTASRDQSAVPALPPGPGPSRGVGSEAPSPAVGPPRLPIPPGQQSMPSARSNSTEAAGGPILWPEPAGAAAAAAAPTAFWSAPGSQEPPAA